MDFLIILTNQVRLPLHKALLAPAPLQILILLTKVKVENDGKIFTLKKVINNLFVSPGALLTVAHLLQY